VSRFVLAAFLLIFTGCRQEIAPVRAASAFAEANRDGDCKTMWSLITANARADIQKRMAWRELPAPSVDFRAMFNPRSAKLIELDGETALVSVIEDVPAGFLVPGFGPRASTIGSGSIHWSRKITPGKWDGTA